MMASSSSPALGGIIGDEESVCYLCLGGDLDDDGQPLRRDCACRGTDAGFVHLSCLANYAAIKSKGWDGRLMNEFVNPWCVCPSCHQHYQNEFAVDIAAKFVSFVRGQYPDDTQRQVESLFTKLCAFDYMLERLQPVQKRETGVTANVLLSLIDRMKGDASPLPRRYSHFEAYTYHTHGRIAINEGTEESARRAVIHFEKLLDVSEAISDDDGIAMAKANIALAKTMFEDGGVKAEVVMASEGGAVCYLCLDGGLLEPLRRDCACRGTDAGFVHLSCLTNYAETKSKQARGMIEFRDPWMDCPSCHQAYQNELRNDIATEFVSFVRRQYPRDTEKQVVSLFVKLCAFDSMFERLQPVQKREAGVTANVMISLIDRMKEDVSPLPERYSQIESYAHGIHGRIALAEGTEESARKAVVHFEKLLEVSEAIDNYQGIANAKANIAYARSKYEGGRNNEELLKANQELYELRAAELGEEHEYTIIAGKNYALRLRQANRGEEARELLMKLLVTSKQVLGPHHNTTQEIDFVLKEVIKVANQE
jgi:hypothetical protein